MRTHASTDGENLSGNVACLVADEVGHHVCHILRLSHPSDERAVFGIALKEFVWIDFPEEVVVNKTRRNTVDANAILSVFSCSHASQSLFVIQALGKDNVVPIQIAELETYDPELAATKATRSLIEYYFTITPCWPLYLFDTFNKIEQIT